MTAWAAIAGSATAWLLVLVLWTGLGYGTVLAWGRWGGRLPLPNPVERAVSMALGPPAGSLDRTDFAPPPSVTHQEPPVEASQTVVPVATATVEAITAEEPPVGSEEDEPEEETEDESAPRPVPDAARPPRPVQTRSRAEALAELSGILKIEYEAAAALLDHGLWGFENYEEWTRSMRGCARPDDIPEDAWEVVTHRTWRDLEEEVGTYRERHAALQGLESLWGVGPDEASALYDAGYRDMAAIRKASTDAIAKIPGIGAAKAFQIRAAAHGLAPTP